MGSEMKRKDIYTYVERTRVVNFIMLSGGDPLRNRAEGLYDWVRCIVYMRDSLLKS